MNLRWLGLALVFAAPAFGQAARDPSTEPRVIVVPVPAEAVDAGTQAQDPNQISVVVPTPAEPAPAPAPTPASTEPAPIYLPPPEPAANQTPQQPVDMSLLPPDSPKNGQVGAMLDGHPREGAFLAGPGSFGFILHHTLWGSGGALATQMVPRFQNLTILDTLKGSDPTVCADPNNLADICSAADPDDRAAYLTAGLIGAGVGFAASAIWQFTHWLDGPAVTGGFLHGLYGALFFAGFAGLLTTDALPISWLSFIGSELAAWASIIAGGGELSANKVLFISTGAFWATAFMGFLLGIIATSNGGSDVRTSLNVLFLAPGVGALALGLFSLKYSPSAAKILRANLFGVLAGAAVFVVSALVLGVKFDSPVPYVLAPIASAGAITLVSLLWADAAESPTAPADGAAKSRARGDLWWW